MRKLISIAVGGAALLMMAGCSGNTENVTAPSLEFDNDLRLTDAQIESLTLSPKPGLVVLTNPGGDPIHYIYVVDGKNGPVFVNYLTENMTELDDGYVSPDLVFKGPELVDPTLLASHTLQESTVEWGIWNATPAAPAGLYADPNYASPSESQTDPFYYVVADVVDVANLSKRLETFNVAQTCEANSGEAVCWSATSSFGQVRDFSGSLELLDFSNGTGLAYISLSTDNDDENWSADFEVRLQGSQFMAYTVSSSYLSTPDGSYSDTTGKVSGYFTGSADHLYLIAVFQLVSLEARHHVEGVMLLQVL